MTTETEGNLIERKTVLAPEVLLAQIALLQAKIKIQDQRIAELTRDPLTGADEFRKAYPMIENLFKQTYQQGIPMVVMMADINDFKLAQDPRSHLWGDHAIAMTAAGLQYVARLTDTVFRFGGDEFLILLPGLSEVDLEKVRGRMEHSLDDIEIKGGGYSGKVGLTIGAAISRTDNFEALLKRADENLKERKTARKAGR